MIVFKVAVVIAIAFGLGAIAWLMSLLMPSHAMPFTFVLMGLVGVGVANLLEHL
jgi:undecaprenyl pyrophosphate phosphatase UppP